MHWQNIITDERGKSETELYGLGLNYLLKGHANRISLDVSYLDHDLEEIGEDIQDRLIVTFQIAAGF